MNILRGTFRISLVVAVLAGIWGGVSEWKRPADDFGRQYDQVWQAQETLKCGKRSVEFSPDETVQHATNVYGNIDLSQLGCATTSFFTNPDELSRDPAALWPLPRFEDQRAGESALTNAALYAITAFIAISVLGLIAAAFQWALRGFKAS